MTKTWATGLLVLAGALAFAGAEYSIDDRDSRITYDGSRPWERFSNAAYMGTT